MSKPLDYRETSNAYFGEVIRQGRYRVIICKDNIQWIVQRQKSGAGARWEALGYCVTQKALARIWTAHLGALALEIAQLPAHFNAQRQGQGYVNEV